MEENEKMKQAILKNYRREVLSRQQTEYRLIELGLHHEEIEKLLSQVDREIYSKEVR